MLTDGRANIGRSGEPGREPALEHVGRLDQVVVDRDHRDAHGTGLGFWEEELVAGQDVAGLER